MSRRHRPPRARDRGAGHPRPRSRASTRASTAPSSSSSPAPGRVVVTGMGKSGLIGQKISATLASTGTPSLFLHPAEAIHGDLGPHRQGRRRARHLLQRRHRGDPGARPAGEARWASPLVALTGQPALRAGRAPPTCTSTSRSARRPARSASRPPPPPPPPWPWATRWPWRSWSGAASRWTTSRCSTRADAWARSCCGSRT